METVLDKVLQAEAAAKETIAAATTKATLLVSDAQQVRAETVAVATEATERSAAAALVAHDAALEKTAADAASHVAADAAIVAERFTKQQPALVQKIISHFTA